MKIYKISSDPAYKNLTGINEETIGQFHAYKGQSLVNTWTPPVFALVEEVTKVKSEKEAEAKKKSDFCARCYGNILLLQKQSSKQIQLPEVEFLPVEVKNFQHPFVFANVLTVLEAINFSGLDYKQSMDMIKSNQIIFQKEAISNHLIFRDKKLITFYYCTEDFVTLINNHKVTGLSFEFVGTAD